MTTIDAAALRREGEALYERGDASGALEAFRRMLDVQPEDPDVLSDLGAISFAIGRVDDAEWYLTRALAADPDHVEAKQNLRLLCQATGAALGSVMSRIDGAGVAHRAAPTCDVSVVVPVHDGFDVFDTCLDALFAQTFRADRYEVIAVANGIADGAQKDLTAVLERWGAHFGDRLRVYHVEEGSIALARNEGIRHARGRIVLQINSDTVLARTAVAEHYAEHESLGFDPRCVIVGGREFPPAYLRSLFNYLHESIPLYTALHHERPRYLADSSWFVTCNLSCLRDAYDRFGLYDPTYSWGSDQELGGRWQEQGVRTYVNTMIVGYHLHWLSFASWRQKCITGAPYWFRRNMGMPLEELSAAGRRAVREKLDESLLDVAAVEAEIRRIEAAFTGPETFGGETIMGTPGRTLTEFNGRMRMLLAEYRTHLQYTELWKRIEVLGGAEAPRRAG